MDVMDQRASSLSDDGRGSEGESVEEKLPEEESGGAWISYELKQLSALGLLRTPKTRAGGSDGRIELQGKNLINFSSNDYLGLSQELALVSQASEAGRRWGSGSGASRLVSGTFFLHRELEAALSKVMECEGSLVFGSGYLANIGSIPVIARRNDRIFADRLAHASLIDGIQLSRAKLQRFRHNCLTHLEDLLKQAKKTRRPGERFLLITEAVFSMDGDLAPLEEMSRLARDFDAYLFVDEAHAVGLYGESGGGLLTELGIRGEEIVKSMSFGKALAGYGGAVLGAENLCELLLQKARSFVFHTALPPSILAGTLAALEFFRDERKRRKLRANSRCFRERLMKAGFSLPEGDSPIIAVRVSGNEACSNFSRALQEAGIFAPAIRSPTVPVGMERIRLSLSAAHSDALLEEALEILICSGKEAGVLR